MTRFLRDGIRLIFILALVVALIAVLLGQRAAIGRGAGRATRAGRSAWDSLRDGPVGAAVAEHARAAAGAVVAVGALVLVLWSNPTGLVVLVIGIVVALLLAAVWAMAHRRVEVGLPAG